MVASWGGGVVRLVCAGGGVPSGLRPEARF